jgi:hypothetical protein
MMGIKYEERIYHLNDNDDNSDLRHADLNKIQLYLNIIHIN